MYKINKPTLLALLALLLGLTFLAWIVFAYAMGLEYRLNQKTEAARILVGRAIQLERFGKIGASQFISFYSWTRVPARIYSDPLSISCKDKVALTGKIAENELPLIVILENRPLFWLPMQPNFWSAAVIYSGMPADLLPVLNSPDPRRFFEPQKSFISGTEAPIHLRGNGLEAYRDYIEFRDVRWESKDCGAFSYTTLTVE
jgi:hypothetical protein